MKKLSLDIHALRVESFDTAAAARAGGTVHGHATGFGPGCYGGSSGEVQCVCDTWEYNSCGCPVEETVYGSCAGTCDASCGGTCDVSCAGTCAASCYATCGCVSPSGEITCAARCTVGPNCYIP
jgi:hypothetical protein